MEESIKDQSVESIQEWIVAKIAEMAEISPDMVDVDEPFANFGLSSVDAISLSGDLEDLLGRKLPPTLLYDYPTINEMSIYLAEEES